MQPVRRLDWRREDIQLTQLAQFAQFGGDGPAQLVASLRESVRSLLNWPSSGGMAPLSWLLSKMSELLSGC